MSTFLLISDTHRDDETFLSIRNKYPHLFMIHGGDSCMEKDDKLLEGGIVVKGNHDLVDFDEFIVYESYFICHGHTFGVYYGFDEMIKQAKKFGCHTIIHGHTHICFDEIVDGIRIINPGSAMINRGSYGYGTYAILDNDKLTFYHHTTHEIVTNEVLEEGKRTLKEFRDLINEFKL